MGRYYESFEPSIILVRHGPVIPDYQHEYAFGPAAKDADERLEADVERRLGALAGALDVTAVHVAVENGFVTLTGEVPSGRVRDAVYDFADHTVGVRGVLDRLEVRQA